MSIASTIPTLMLAAVAGLAVAGVAALTVKVELTAKRFGGLKRSLSRFGAGANPATSAPHGYVDNGWLTSVVRSFES